MKRIALVFSLGLAFALNAGARENTSTKTTNAGAVKPTSTQTMSLAKATQDEIRKTLGTFPTFLRKVPAESLPGVWDSLKGTQLSASSAIPHKYKELIGLAVASQIPCRYCAYFHAENGKQLGGTTERENLEAIALAAESRAWSAYFNGAGIDLNSFKAEVDKMMESMRNRTEQQQAGTVSDSNMNTTNTSETANVNTAQWAYQDMQKTLGFTPNFIKSFPEQSVSGAWRSFKNLNFKETSIPSKYKSLISLAVASQSGCSYCLYFDRKSLELAGASEREVGEAIVMASTVRYLSTILNGNLVDEKTFRAEANQMFKFVKANMKKQPQIGKTQPTSDQAGSVPEEAGYPLEQ